MKKENILMFLFGIQITLELYYLPQSLKNIFEMVTSETLLLNFTYILQTLAYYIFSIIGCVGAYYYYQNKNIFNPFLKIYFIYDLFSFFVQTPNSFYFILTSSIYVNWQFYVFQIVNFITVILVVIIFSKEKIRVKEIPVKKTGTRLNHFIVDLVFLILMSIQSYGSFFWVEDVIGSGVYYLILFTFFPYLLFIIYYWVSETIFQQTLGKVITKKYVRRIDGYRASFGSILGRTLCRVIPFEPFSYLSSPPNGWHDSLSGTNVFERLEGEFEEEIMEHLISDDEGY